MTASLAFDFGGKTYDKAHDRARLNAQLSTVRRLVSDGAWHTLGELSRVSGYPEASISARLRDMRKPRFGEHVIERRRVVGGNGLHEYRMVLR